MLDRVDVWGMITGRLQGLERDQERQAAYVEGNDWYALRVAPSCPPDKRLHLRGGLAYTSRQSGSSHNYRAYTVPDLTADLCDTDQVTSKEFDRDTNSITYSGGIRFTNANWYRAYVLLLNLPAEVEEPTVSDWTFWLWGTGTELEIAGEAEAHMEWNTLTRATPWKNTYTGYHGYPLCGLILRNDGTTGTGCNILPVDVANRGRSYQWPADVRPRRYIAR